MKKICPACKSYVEFDGDKCPACEKNKNHQTATSKSSLNRKLSKIEIIGGLLFAFAIIGFLVFPHSHEKNSRLVQTKQEANKGPYSVLKVSDVNADNKEVNISGNTDLPTGAILTIGFDVWGRADSDLYIGVDKNTTVSNGKFNVGLEVPQRDEFKKGPYEVSVLFTPRGQSDSVIALVGKDGENLEGDLVDRAFGSFNTLQLEEKVNIQLSVSPPSYTFQTPSEFPQGSAERALAEYITAWKNQNWQRMVKFSQKTWVSAESDPARTLKGCYDFKTLKGFEVKGTKTISDAAKDITFVVYYEAITNQIDKKQITARVIKETAPYKPSSQGQWGVNPISALREN